MKNKVKISWFGCRIANEPGEGIMTKYSLFIILLTILITAFVGITLSGCGSIQTDAEKTPATPGDDYVMHSYAGIDFSLPDTWKPDEEWPGKETGPITNDTYRNWSPGREDVSFSVQVCNDYNPGINGEYSLYKEGGIQQLDEVSTWIGTEGTELIGRGTIEVDGITGYYIDYKAPGERYDYTFEYVRYVLYIPLKGEDALVKTEFFYELGGSYSSDNSDDYTESEYLTENKDIRENVLNSIKIN